MFAIPLAFVTVTLVLVRAVLAVAFIREALLKLRDLRKFSKNDSIPLPLAAFVAIAEAAAALSFATGLLAQWAGLGIMLLMLITTGMHVFKWHSTYWAQKGGPEYDLLLFTLAAVVTVFGPGSFAINF